MFVSTVIYTATGLIFSVIGKSNDLKNTTQSMQMTKKWDSNVAQSSKKPWTKKRLWEFPLVNMKSENK